MGLYYYHGTDETLHPQLGLLKPGENDIPESLEDAAEECVEAGLLSHSATPPSAPVEPMAPMASIYPDDDANGGQEPDA